MFKKLKPDIFVKKFTDITPDTIFSLGAKAMTVDLDGTMASKHTAIPTNEVLAWIQTFVDANIKFIILSNNKFGRVNTYCEKIGVPYFNSAKKPFKVGFKKALGVLGSEIKPDEIVMIGDQIYTDTFVARRFGAKSIYVYPIDETSKYTRFRLNFSEKHFLKGAFDE